MHKPLAIALVHAAVLILVIYGIACLFPKNGMAVGGLATFFTSVTSLLSSALQERL